MKCMLSLKNQQGIELNTFEMEGKYHGDVLQNMEDKLCKEIEPYNTYSLKNCRNINKKATKKTLHFKDGDNVLSYVIEILDAQYLKNSI